MKRRSASLALLLLLLLVPGIHAAGWSEDGDDLRIRLVTAAPGHRDPSAWYGHTGILVEDASSGSTTYFGYRLDTSTEIGDLKRALRTGLGESRMHLEAIPLDVILDDYGSQGRGVRALELDMDADAKVRLVQGLAEEAGAGTWYSYHTMTDNCATRLRDHLDAALDGRLRTATDQSDGRTLRDVTHPYLDHAPVSAVAMRFFAGDAIDEPITGWDRLFLPLELEAAVKSLDVAGPQETLLEPADAAFVPAPEVRPVGTLLLVSSAVAAGLVALTTLGAHRLPVQRTVAGVLFLLGLLLTPVALLMLVLWSGPLGAEYAHNENLLVVPPTVAAYIPLAAMALLRRPGAWRLLHMWSLLTAVFAVAAAVLKVLPWFDQANQVGIALFVPLQVGVAVAVRQIYDVQAPEPDPAPSATTA